MKQTDIETLKATISLTEKEKKEILHKRMKRMNSLFEGYCKKGDFEMIKYVLTSDEIDFNYDINFSTHGFSMLCKKNKIEIIKYLLTSKDLKQHYNINNGSALALYSICENGHLELLKFVMTCPEIAIKPDLYSMNSRAITASIKHIKMAEYLLFEEKIDTVKLPPPTQAFFNELKYRKNAEELDGKLTEKLNKKNKIKI